jgi:hypothetical protein
MRKGVVMVLFVSVLAACGGGGFDPDYETYGLYYDGLKYFREDTGGRYSRAEFQDYADRTCGRDPEDLGEEIDNGDITSTYFLIRMACGEDVADAALAESSEPESSKRYISRDFDDAREIAENNS